MIVKRYLLQIILICAGFSSLTCNAQSTIQKVRETGTLTLGVRDASGVLSYRATDGNYVGFHVDICLKIVAAIEQRIGKNLTVKYQSVTSQNRIPLLQNGMIDLECGSTTNNAARQREVTFAATTFVEEVKLAVKPSSGISSVSQLNGKTVATTAGTNAIALLQKSPQAQGISFVEVFGKTHADSFNLLMSGRADAFVMDSQILALNIAANRLQNEIKILDAPLSSDPIGIMIRKDDIELKKMADETIAGLVSSGELNSIYSKWFINQIPNSTLIMGLPVNSSTRGAWSNLNDKPVDDYINGFPSTVQRSSMSSTSPQRKELSSSNKEPIDDAKTKCTELGFKANTESFGKCVLKLSK